MNGYYYILSSLTQLDLNSNFQLENIKDFLEKIKFFVPKRDFAKIEGLVKGDRKVKIKLLDEYISKKKDIDNILLEKRELRLKGQNKDYKLKGPQDSQLESMVDKVFNNPNPLEAEKTILSLYWNILDRISAFHYFDFTALCVYVLKLQILYRLKSFDKIKGQEEFNKLFEETKILYSTGTSQQ